MIKKKGQPITGSPNVMSKKRPFVPDAKETSADAQTTIAEAPSPFKNRMQTGEMPTGAGASGGVSTLLPKIASGLQHSSPGVKALPDGGAVGQARMPNQSAQIGGRMGFPPPKRRAGNVASGIPSKRKASLDAFYGR